MVSSCACRELSKIRYDFDISPSGLRIIQKGHQYRDIKPETEMKKKTDLLNSLTMSHTMQKV